jgi:hypothetical protein
MTQALGLGGGGASRALARACRNQVTDGVEPLATLALLIVACHARDPGGVFMPNKQT